MPDFEDSDVDVGGIDDRRGRGGLPMAIGGGGGIVGLVVFLLVQLLGGEGGIPFQVPGGTQIQGESLDQLRTRCNQDGAIEQYNDCFLIKVYNEINEIWSEELEGYERPLLAFFEQGVQTACGPASSEVGPFYCPGDREIYIDIGFLQALQQEFGAGGRNAQAYILAHEFGHHLQTLLGIEPKVRQAQQRQPGRSNALSIAMELQADCYAGVWSRLADERGNVSITEAELEEALNAAEAVGDDRIQKKAQGRVDPESWTHGSAEHRRTWYLRGFSQASRTACNTFTL